MDKYDFINQLQNCKTAAAFDQILSSLHTILQQEQQLDLWKRLATLSNYPKNIFSHAANNQEMLIARDRLLDYLLKNPSSLDPDSIKLQQLTDILKNFLLFKESLIDRPLDKRATIRPSALCPTNEYDIQHLLYAMLKPAFPTLRSEVSADSGVAAVRADLFIDELSVIIETKCSRSSMTQRDLTEEIEADIVHYTAQHIFFLIYDKDRIIKDPIPYQQSLSRPFGDKKITLIIEQPKQL
jgi:hypothetical protein